MSNKNYDREFTRQYVKDVTSTEKKLFTLKMIRDTLFDKANECRKNAQDLPNKEKYNIILPEEVDHEFKQVPKEPKFKMNTKSYRWRRRLFQLSVGIAALLFVSFVALLIDSVFFTKQISDYSVTWVVFILMCAITVFSFLSVFAITGYEYIKFKEKHVNWENEKAYVDSYNEKLTEKINSQKRDALVRYNMEVQEIEQLKRYDTLVEKAKAEITDLQSGKISASIVTLESFLKQLYSLDILPGTCRRIDAMVSIDCMLEADPSLTVEESVQIYLEGVSSGECVKHLSDFYSEYNKYSKTMPAFATVLDKIEKGAEYYVEAAAEQADVIARDASDEISNSVNGSIISLEFQRIYERTELAIFAADANAEAIQFVSRYMSNRGIPAQMEIDEE